MALGCGAACARIILIIFNIIFWLSGAGMLALGLWMLFDPNISARLSFVGIAGNAADEADGFSTGSLLEYAAYVVIAVGAFVFIVGFFGCCGAIKQSKCLLGLYIFFLFLVMLIEFAAAILGIYFQSQIFEKIKDEYGANVEKHFGKTDKDGLAFTEGINWVQIEGKCCGWENPGTEYASQTTIGGITASCCKFTGTTETTANLAKMNETDLYAASLAATGTACSNTERETDTCRDTLEDWIKEHAFIIIGVGIGIGCIELFGIIFACCLCRNVGDEE